MQELGTPERGSGESVIAHHELRRAVAHELSQPAGPAGSFAPKLPARGERPRLGRTPVEEGQNLSLRPGPRPIEGEVRVEVRTLREGARELGGRDVRARGLELVDPEVRPDRIELRAARAERSRAAWWRSNGVARPARSRVGTRERYSGRSATARNLAAERPVGDERSDPSTRTARPKGRWRLSPLDLPERAAAIRLGRPRTSPGVDDGGAEPRAQRGVGGRAALDQFPERPVSDRLPDPARPPRTRRGGCAARGAAPARGSATRGQTSSGSLRAEAASADPFPDRFDRPRSPRGTGASPDGRTCGTRTSRTDPPRTARRRRTSSDARSEQVDRGAAVSGTGGRRAAPARARGTGTARAAGRPRRRPARRRPRSPPSADRARRSGNGPPCTGAARSPSRGGAGRPDPRQS